MHMIQQQQQNQQQQNTTFRVFFSVISVLFSFSVVKFVFIPGATETVYVRYIALNKDGSIANETYVPRCEEDRRIKLDSYQYLNRTCYPGSMCLTGYTGQLSLLAEYHLHESCSMKKVCHNLSFPAIDIEAGGYNTVFVRYQCISKYTSLIFNVQEKRISQEVY